VPEALKGYNWSYEAAEQLRVMLQVTKGKGGEFLIPALSGYLTKNSISDVTPDIVETFITTLLPKDKSDALLPVLRFSARRS
jgi:hypothetical protein